MMRRLALLVLSLVVAGALPALAQEPARYALLVQGASGEPQYATLHREWLDKLSGVLRERLRFEAANLLVLAEQPGEGEERATAESVKAALGRLAGTIKEDDLLFIVMIGHGSDTGNAPKFNLIGPDLTAADWNTLLQPIAGRIVVVDTTSASFGFLGALAAPGRVVITATNAAGQRYHTQFPEAFVQALADPAADIDKNQRISVLEAFNHASRLVVQHYEQAGTLRTEHALIDDTGDGEGRLATDEGDDGLVAEATYLDVVAAPTSSDPEMQKLLQRQQALNSEIEALRRRRPTMAAEEYQKEFERLVTELAVVSRQIREKGGG